MSGTSGWYGRSMESGGRRLAALLSLRLGAALKDQSRSDAQALVGTALRDTGVTVRYTMDAFPYISMQKHFELGKHIVFEDSKIQ